MPVRQRPLDLERLPQLRPAPLRPARAVTHQAPPAGSFETFAIVSCRARLPSRTERAGIKVRLVHPLAVPSPNRGCGIAPDDRFIT